MAPTELLANLHLLTPGGWQVYLWRDEDGVTLIDAGAASSGPGLRAALAELGLRAGDVDRLVLTHFHDDHTGGAAEVAGWGEVEVLAHAQDAPIIRGERSGPPPNYSSEQERALHAQVARALPPAPPCRVDRELVDGEVLDIAGGALVVATPGHTDGSMALLLQRPRVLFTGDTVAEHRGQIILGPFNLDRDRATVSFRALAELDADVACFGHGQPVIGSASAALAAAAANPTTR
jgi:glyoxylase-like metal-dependent hydrolase (beta-lactamase superfamily II)